MVIVLIDHVLHIPFPPVSHIRSVVILCLMHIPAVHILVHHQHAEPVAHFELIFGTRVVRGTDGIVAGFLQDPDPSLFSLRISAGTQDPVVMMNAGSADYDTFSVDGNALLRIP